jgi:hypothetical protein
MLTLVWASAGAAAANMVAAMIRDFMVDLFSISRQRPELGKKFIRRNRLICTVAHCLTSLTVLQNRATSREPYIPRPATFNYKNQLNDDKQQNTGK